MDRNPLDPRAIAQLVEYSEARAYRSLFADAAARLGPGSGLVVDDIGAAVALQMAGARSSVALNRVIGLGLDVPVSEADLDRLVTRYAAAGAPMGIELSPLAQPPELPLWLRQRGVRKAFQAHLVYRACSPTLNVYDAWAATSGLRVEPTGPAFAATLARLTQANFRMPEQTLPLLTQGALSPAWRRWVAFDGQTPIGGGYSYVEQGVCWFGWSSVMPEYRGRGVYQAIMARYLQDAAECGCAWSTTDAVAGTSERPNPAYLAMKKLGFEDAYIRPIYLRAPR